jgi:prophage regulatory protein
MDRINDILNQQQLLSFTGLARSTMYHYIKTMDFPAPKKIGKRKVYWSKKEVLSWFEKKGFDIKKEQK